MRCQAGRAHVRAGAAPGRTAKPTGASPTEAVLQRLQRAHMQSWDVPPHHLLQLGSVVGNGAVQRAIAGGQPTLRIGSRVAAVRALQEALVAAGASLGVDGIFGAQTQAAVMAFQRAAGVSADGVVGPMTWGRFDSGGVRIGQPGAGGGHAQGTLATLASAKLAELSALVKQVKARGPRPGAGVGYDTIVSGIWTRAVHEKWV